MNEQELDTSVNEVMEISGDIYNRLSNYREAKLSPETATSILELNHVHRLAEVLLEQLDDIISR